MKDSITYLSTTLFLLLLLFTGCNSTSYSIAEPHYYSDPYLLVIKNVEDVLQQEGIKIDRSEAPDENTYRIFYYKYSSSNYSSGSSNSITIKKLDSARTSIRIIEDKGSGLTRNVHADHAAKNIFKALEELLSLEPKGSKEAVAVN